MKIRLNTTETLATIARFFGDVSGIAVVEFALILPVMLVLYLGVADVSRAIRASQKVDNAAHVVADLIARKLKDANGDVTSGAVITDRDLDDAFTTARLLIVPLSLYHLIVEIDEIKTGDRARRLPPQLVWRAVYKPGAAAGTRLPSRSCAPPPLIPGSGDEFLNVPEGLAYSPSGKDYLIAARVYYDFGAGASPFMFGKTSIFKQWAYAVPRAVPPSSGDNPLKLTSRSGNWSVIQCTVI